MKKLKTDSEFILNIIKRIEKKNHIKKVLQCLIL